MSTSDYQRFQGKSIKWYLVSLHASWVASSSPEIPVVKAFALLLDVFVGILQLGRSSGKNLSLSVYIVFVSKAIICNLSSPVSPREPML